MSATLGFTLTEIEEMEFEELRSWHEEARRIRDAAPGCAWLTRKRT